MKILWISEPASHPTGYGNQTLGVLKELQRKGHDVHNVGWYNPPTTTPIFYQEIPIYGVGPGFGTGSDILNLFHGIKPDCIVSLGDIHCVQNILEDIKDLEFRKHWAHWFPLDSEQYPASLHPWISPVNTLVAMSDFAYPILTKHHPNVHKIYHGVDTRIFFTIPRPKNQKFTAICVAKNNWRKCFPYLFQVFEKFKNKGYKDFKLIMHTATGVPLSNGGWSLPSLAKIFNISDHIIFSPKATKTDELNKLYNSADIFASTPAGEGFNIPAIEAMAVGLPLLLPEWTTGKEFIDSEKPCGRAIKTAAFSIQPDVMLKRAIIDIDDAANKLEELYKLWSYSPHQFEELKQNARNNVARKYDITNIATQWEDVLKTICRHAA